MPKAIIQSVSSQLSDHGTRLKRSLLLIGVSALATGAFATPAFAQDSGTTPPSSTPVPPNGTPPQPAAQSPQSQPEQPTNPTPTPPTGANAGGTEQEVVVTGLRGSLQRDLNIKRAAPGIVDAISAEDIGKFPDANIASAMQRIPGVSINRGSTMIGGTPTTTGDGTQITVRGFGPSFNETLFDGRRISTALGAGGGGTSGNRSFDFSSVGADFVGEVDVLKTPDAALSAGAIGATINIQFPKPFDHPGLRVAGFANGSWSPDAHAVTPSAGLLVSDTFANDTIGFLADVDYSDHKYQQNHVNIQGWEGTLFAPSQLAGAGAGASTTASIPGWFIQDYGIYQEHTEDKRIDGRAVLQWKPDDTVLFSLNYDYSRDKLRAQQYGYSVWFNAGQLTNIQQDSHGTVTNFNQPNTPTDFQSQINGSINENQEFGANLKWDATPNFKLTLDADRAVSRSNPGGELNSIDVDVGYGSCAEPLPGGGNECRNVNNIGILVGGPNALPVPTQWGPGAPHPSTTGSTGNGNLIATDVLGSHVLPIGSNRNRDAINQFRAEGEWHQDDLKIRFGVHYVEDSERLRTYDDFANNDWQAYSGYGPASNHDCAASTGNNPATGQPCTMSGIALPASFFGQSFSTSNFIPGFSGSGSLPPNVLVFNPYTVLNYLQALGNPHATTIPGYNPGDPAYAGTYDIILNPSSYLNVTEKDLAGYLAITDTVHVGDMPLHINVGIREEITRLTTQGIGQLPTTLTIQTGDHTAFNVAYTDATLVTGKNRYSYLLPNLDLGLEVSRTLKLRFDASRTLTRPPLNLITPVLNVTGTQRVGSLVASGSNPKLRPFQADNFDLGLEWYYAPNSYFSIDGYIKHVTDFVVLGSSQRNINGVIDPTTGQPAIFTVTLPVNGPSATVRGVEVALQHVFGKTGFGFQANATLVNTNKPYNANDTTLSGFAVTGLANSANLVAFYDKNGFQVRAALNWRARYLDHFGQTQNNSRFGTEPTFVNASTTVDASASYDINRNISVYIEGLNLTNESYSTTGRFSNQLLDIVRYGRRFTAGVHFRF